MTVQVPETQPAVATPMPTLTVPIPDGTRTQMVTVGAKNEAISLPRGYQLPEGPVFPVVQACPFRFPQTLFPPM